MNMGSIKDGLLAATVCEMVWSILAKALSLGGVRLMKRWLFVLVSRIEDHRTLTGKIRIYSLRQFHLLQSKYLKWAGDKFTLTSEKTFDL